MKAIKTYLQNQKDVALTMWANELQKDSPNLVLSAWWNDRVIHLDSMLKELNNKNQA